MNFVKHPFDPIFDKNSKVLILGSFPSIKSRECNFYYSHTKNRFWEIIAHITNNDLVPIDIFQKKFILINNKIALWDVVKSCDIKASIDSSINNVIPNDIDYILQNSLIKQIFANGNKAYDLFKKFFPRHSVINLPSTSSANAKYSIDDLINEWKIITKY